MRLISHSMGRIPRMTWKGALFLPLEGIRRPVYTRWDYMLFWLCQKAMENLCSPSLMKEILWTKRWTRKLLSSSVANGLQPLYDCCRLEYNHLESHWWFDQKNFRFFLKVPKNYSDKLVEKAINNIKKEMREPTLKGMTVYDARIDKINGHWES